MRQEEELEEMSKLMQWSSTFWKKVTLEEHTRLVIMVEIGYLERNGGLSIDP